MTKRGVLTSGAPAPFAPYSQAIVANGFVFVAGQVGMDPATGEVVSGGIEAQTHQALANIAAILEAAGSSLEHVVKTSVFMVNAGDYARVNAIYETYFSQPLPARSTMGVAALGGEELIEIEAIAVVSDQAGANSRS